jgi:hypothetical protein
MALPVLTRFSKIGTVEIAECDRVTPAGTAEIE